MTLPKSIAEGSLDMTLRKLLSHMLNHELNHVVLVIPGTSVQISVTIAPMLKTQEITKQIERILL